jgi:hypothetical protein
MASKPRISNLDLTQNSEPVVNFGTADSYYMNSKYVRYAPDRYSRSIEGLLDGPDGPGKPNEIPQLSDIESVTKSVYVDTKTNETKAKLVIRIRNSSGKTLSGIDARIAIPTGSGGQE